MYARTRKRRSQRKGRSAASAGQRAAAPEAGLAPREAATGRGRGLPYRAGPAAGLALPVQAAPEIGERDDTFEREADAVADGVVADLSLIHI